MSINFFEKNCYLAWTDFFQNKVHISNYKTTEKLSGKNRKCWTTQWPSESFRPPAWSGPIRWRIHPFDPRDPHKAEPLAAKMPALKEEVFTRPSSLCHTSQLPQLLNSFAYFTTHLHIEISGGLNFFFLPIRLNVFFPLRFCYVWNFVLFFFSQRD